MTNHPHRLTDLSAGVMKQGVLHDLKAIREAAPNNSHVQRLEKTATAFYESLAQLDAQLLEVNNDPHLSAEGKQAKRTELGAAWKESSAQQLASVEAAANALTGNSEPLTIPPPVEDASLLEAKLANARSDARMLLDGVDPLKLATRMRELVERNADPLITYLLVGTEWGNNYIRSRHPNAGGSDITAPLLDWAHHRGELYPRLLDDAGRKEWERRQRFAKVPRILQVVSATREFAIRDRRL